MKDSQPQLGFAASWLETRYPFDEEARNPELEELCREMLEGHSPLQVVDVGSGTGSNAKYYMERLPGDQTWYLVEKDPVLCQATLEHLPIWARHKGWNAKASGNVIHFTRKGQSVRMNICNASLLELPGTIPLEKIDLMVANAVFDLFSPSQFASFAETIAQFKFPFLTTLNYESMAFSPSHKQDAQVIKWYEQHMEREQEFGTGMGRHCSRNMTKMLRETGAEVTCRDSLWDIGPGSRDMMGYMLSFMKGALSEMSLGTRGEEIAEAWYRDRMKALEGRSLSLTVAHKDLLAAW